ncbi:HD domain-containing protein [Halobacterium litoreum]|uniref:HD domain-containing protein n=1 Tax=Halobacterium litoreum TaxID=2039234 RepID=A0ABD5NCV6_9EURY|nr:HD domain-containing protein [Halobacterium litoreum]UHH14103.1 HD domain-containing protein [Halobacterium litoreum]
MTTIKDSVHDHIEVEGVAADLLDTPPVQRLRRITQLGTVSLVYPSANHTRFEHSLGVYHLADRALDHLDIGGKRAERVRAAAVLHDVGHSPFSHNVEGVVERHTGKRHDDVDGLLAEGRVARVLDDHDLDPANIASLVAGDGELAQLVAGELDVDRMDYLVRDAHHTGVPYGTIDHERLLRALTFIDGELVLDEGNVQTAESLLLARALMNPTVYSHHVARISKSMLRRATERLLDTTEMTAEQLRRMDDHELSVALRSHDETAETGTRLAERDLFKRAVWAEMGDVDDDVVGADHDAVREFERDIAADAGVEPEHVVLDVRGEPSMRESTTGVLVGGEVRRLDEQSTLVNALQVAQREQWRLGVYAPADGVESVGKATERVLGLETEGALVTEVNTPGRYASLDDF